MYLNPLKCFITEDIIDCINKYLFLYTVKYLVKTYSKKMRDGCLDIDFFHRIKMESRDLKPPEPYKCIYTPNRDGLLSSSTLSAR